MINLSEMNLCELTEKEMFDIDGGFLIVLGILLFAAGMAAALYLNA